LRAAARVEDHQVRGWCDLGGGGRERLLGRGLLPVAGGSARRQLLFHRTSFPGTKPDRLRRPRTVFPAGEVLDPILTLGAPLHVWWAADPAASTRVDCPETSVPGHGSVGGHLTNTGTAE